MTHYRERPLLEITTPATDFDLWERIYPDGQYVFAIGVTDIDSKPTELRLEPNVAVQLAQAIFTGADTPWPTPEPLVPTEEPQPAEAMDNDEENERYKLADLTVSVWVSPNAEGVESVTARVTGSYLDISLLWVVAPYVDPEPRARVMQLVSTMLGLIKDANPEPFTQWGADI